MSMETDIRKELLGIALKKPLHLGGCFSAIETLTTLYFKILEADPKNPLDPNRDRFILSKGHAAYALYAVLKRRGYPIGDYSDMCHHPEICPEKGIEATTGALGHGLSIGCGMALAAKRKGLSYKVYVLLGDGECQEGSVWEAARFADEHELNNLVAIRDRNGYQALGPCEDVPVINGFRWYYDLAVGRDDFTRKAKEKNPCPTWIDLVTVKGFGVSFMENQPLWHFRGVTQSEYDQAMKELN